MLVRRAPLWPLNMALVPYLGVGVGILVCAGLLGEVVHHPHHAIPGQVDREGEVEGVVEPSAIGSRHVELGQEPVPASGVAGVARDDKDDVLEHDEREERAGSTLNAHLHVPLAVAVGPLGHEGVELLGYLGLGAVFSEAVDADVARVEKPVQAGVFLGPGEVAQDLLLYKCGDELGVSGFVTLPAQVAHACREAEDSSQSLGC